MIVKLSHARFMRNVRDDYDIQRSGRAVDVGEHLAASLSPVECRYAPRLQQG